MNLIAWFASLSVILASCPLLVSFIAFYVLGHKSDIYKSKAKETVDVKREHAKVAAQVLLAAATWKTLDKSGQGGDVTEEALMEVFTEVWMYILLVHI
jgi:hypothetical protein